MEGLVKRPSGFQKGHQKFGGRKKGSTNKRTKQVQEILEKLNFHPVEFLAIVASTGLMPNPDGTFTPVDPGDRLDSAKAIAPFCAPRLNSVDSQVSNEDSVPQVVLPTMAILQNPKLLDAMSELALLVAQSGPDVTQFEALPPGLASDLIGG